MVSQTGGEGQLHGARNTHPEVCPGTVEIGHSSSLGFFSYVVNESVGIGRFSFSRVLSDGVCSFQKV